VGKFFEAIKRSEALRKAQPAADIQRSDVELLLLRDRKSGRLDLSHPAISGSKTSIQRLAQQGLIEPDGRLTRRGLTACEKLMTKVANQTASSTLSSHGDMGEIEFNGRLEAKWPSEGPEDGNGGGRLAASMLENDLMGRLAVEDASGPAPDPLFSAQPGPAGEVDPDLVVLRKSQSFESEQFKILRSTILFPESGPVPRVIMVTSTEPGEGKSFVAANLAASMAMSLDRHVFLVDCDLRRPSIHKLFRAKAQPGLSEHLAGFQDLSAVMQKTSQTGLYLLTAGKCPENPSEVLSSERMAGFLQETTTRYQDRMLIIDSAPAMLAAESSVLAGFADGIILVVKKNGPPREEVQELVRKLGRKKIIGIVGNFEAKLTSGYYYKMKKYGRYYENA
jgi:protein-tyrosine kinase